VATLDLRLRVTSPELLTLPWREPLAEWDPTTVPLRDIPVGPSRHLVRFVEADRRLWALKALPVRIAQREYDVLRELEHRALAAVRVAGVVVQPAEDAAVLVTHYLERSWQYRRLLMRVPASMKVHRGRLFDAVAVLLVDLHRNGIYWGDCSLANSLFMRDGQSVQAWLVDAETAEVHQALTDGQRRQDLEITVENVAGGLLDVAALREEPAAAMAGILDEAHGIAARYEQLWELLHDEPIVGLEDHYEIEARLRRLNEIGFAVDEVRLEQTGERLRMHVAVAGRNFHSTLLRALAGLDVGEGQATILLNDLHAFHTQMQQEVGREVPEAVAAQHWLSEVFVPGRARAHRAVQGVGDATQAYCDLLEVRWLLSETAGYDVGDGPALVALARREAPRESAANLGFVEMETQELPVAGPELLEELDPGGGAT
jgi:tRNA A-37 threonylcarbamoyl transferase component Bud32